MRNALPDDPLLPEIAKLLPVIARILDQQLHRIEHTPSRRRRLPMSVMVQQAKTLREIIDGLNAIIDLQDAIAAMPKPFDAEAEREALRRELDRIIAAEQRLQAKS